MGYCFDWTPNEQRCPEHKTRKQRYQDEVFYTGGNTGDTPSAPPQPVVDSDHV